VFSDVPLEVAECDKPTGEFAQVKFLYAELGGIDPEAGPEARKQRLVELITGKSNGRLPRTIVNRFWQRLLGHGLVEPVDEMDRPALVPGESSSWLAEDFVAHGYDLKHLLTRILTSRTYQLASVGVSEKPESFVFRGPVVRRLSAEQFSDSLRFVTLGDYGKAATRYNRNVGLSDLGDAAAAPAVVDLAHRRRRARRRAGRLRLRAHLHPSRRPHRGHARRRGGRQLHAPHQRLPARQLRAPRQHQRRSLRPDAPPLRRRKRGRAHRRKPAQPDDHRGDPIPTDKIDNPAGLLAYLRIRVGSEVHDVVTDRQWTAGAPAAREPRRRHHALAVVELGGVRTLTLAPRAGLPRRRRRRSGHAPDRARVARRRRPADGRPCAAEPRAGRDGPSGNRDHLQALEMTNGGTLAGLLRAGAQRVLGAGHDDLPAVIDGLYRRSLARPPRMRNGRWRSSWSAPRRIRRRESRI
jgi:hypothetical protein